MSDRTDLVPERLDMDPVEVPADGTWSPTIDGDGTGQALPPMDPGQYPPHATPLQTGDAMSNTYDPSVDDDQTPATNPAGDPADVPATGPGNENDTATPDGDEVTDPDTDTAGTSDAGETRTAQRTGSGDAADTDGVETGYETQTAGPDTETETGR